MRPIPRDRLHSTAPRFSRLRCAAASLALGITFAAVLPVGSARAASPVPTHVASPAPVPSATPLSGLSVLRNARAAFRTIVRPKYVTYTMQRDEWLDDFFSPDGSYSLHVWYRSSDTGALSRRIEHGSASGKLDYIHPRFDAPIDPGPPTADIFEPARSAAQMAAPTPAPGASELPTIGSIRVQTENDYIAKIVEADDRQYDVELTPRREPDRNRLREMWVDRKTFRVLRFSAADKLFYVHTNVIVPLLLDVRMGLIDGVPVVTSIHAEPNGDDPISIGKVITNFKYTNITFPSALPDWYFDPHDYRAHTADSPTS